MTKNKMHYGWVIVLSCFLLTMFMMLETTTWSYFQVPICEDLGITYVQFSLTSMLATVANMIFGIVLASKIARGNLRFYMLCGGVIAAVLWFIQGFATQFWQICLIYGLINFALATVLNIPINILITNWFIDKKGFALGLALLGSGTGQMLFSTTLANFIATNGWRALTRVYGVINLVAILIVFVLVRKTPAEKGLEPYRSDKNPQAANADSTGSIWMGLTKKEAVSTGAFWAFAVLMLCAGLISSGIVTQVPTFLTESQIPYAAPMVAYSVAVILSKLIMGPLFDKVGIIGGTATCVVMCIGSLVALMLVPSGVIWAYLGVILFGLGCSVASLAPPLLVSALFGVKDYGGIYGFANFFFYGGCMLGAVISAGIRTATGSYFMAWVAFIVISALIFVAVVTAQKLSSKFREQYQ